MLPRKFACDVDRVCCLLAFALMILAAPLATASEPRDFNGDGKSDIVWSNSVTGEKLMWLMNGGTIIGGGTVIVDPDFSIVQNGDFNGNGKTDLVWRDSSTNQLILWLMNGPAFAGGVILQDDSNWSIVAVGDFNGDGKTDLLWRNSSTHQIVMWLMDGTQIIGAAGIFDPTGNPISSTVTFLAADLDGDGKDELLITGNYPGLGSLILSMNGTQILSRTLILPDNNWRAIFVGDFNNDGKADIVWRHTSGATALWLMNGPSFAGGTGLSGYPWDIVGIDDLNGDGKSDVLWHNSITGETAAWLMDGTTLLAGGGLLPGPWQITRTGDFNGDGKADILFTNPVTHDKVMWLMDGLSPSSGYLLSSDPNWSILP